MLPFKGGLAPFMGSLPSVPWTGLVVGGEIKSFRVAHRWLLWVMGLVSVMVARFPARSLSGAIKMSGRVFIVLLFLIAPKWKHKNDNYRKIDKYVIVHSHHGICTCNEWK